MSPTAARDTTLTRALLITYDPDLIEVVQRLAALAHADLTVVSDVRAVRLDWASAPLVLLGIDAVPGCLELRLPRRPDVVLVGDGVDDAAVWQQAVAIGAERVVFFPEAEPWVVEVLADVAEGAAPEGPLVAVIGGRGGAGATTLACSLAVTAGQAGWATLLVDGDPLGGGIDLVFGGEQTPGLRWGDLASTQGRIPAAALAAALPQMSGLSVLSWGRGDGPPLQGEAASAVLSAGRRASDLVVVDLPRVLDEAARVVLAQATLTLLVVPAEVRATAAAGRVAAAVRLLTSDLRVVVRGPAPTGLSGQAVARELGVPLAGQLRPEPRLAAALDRGEPPPRRQRSPLACWATGMLDGLFTGSLDGWAPAEAPVR